MSYIKYIMFITSGKCITYRAESARTAEMKEDPKSEETCSSFQEPTVYQNNNNKNLYYKISTSTS